MLYIKISESAYLTYYQKNRDVILNRAKDYYENNKERLRKQTRDKYGHLFEEEKNKKWEYGKKRCCNISEEKKKRLKKYHKNYREAKKPQYIIRKYFFICDIIINKIVNKVCYLTVYY